MSIVITLILLGLFLIAAEVIVPGGILGLAGGVLILVGSIYAFYALDTTVATLILIATFFITILLIYIQFKILPKTRIGRRFFLSAAIDEQSNSLPLNSQDLIGKSAISVTVLSPTGYIRIGNKRYEAKSESGQIQKDVEVIVSSTNSFQLIVHTKT